MPTPGDHSPRFLAWWIAAISIVLPVAGGLLLLAGVSQLLRGGDGILLLVSGAGLLALDLAIDFWWAHPSVSRSDQPELNARGRQLVGRLAVVEEAIEHGLGKVRLGDTLWPAEGPDTAAGRRVRVTGLRGTRLVVEHD